MAPPTSAATATALRTRKVRRTKALACLRMELTCILRMGNAVLSFQIMGDVRAIFKNFKQWPTAMQADGDYVTYVRQQVR